MTELNQLPNIGPTLEKKLKDVEITTPEILNKLGSEQVFLRLSIQDESSCFNMLCALEGAIQGIRWHHLPKKRKDELKEFMRLKRI